MKYIAGSFEMFLARLFGRMSEHVDGGYYMRCYMWRGRMYIDKLEPAK